MVVHLRGVAATARHLAVARVVTQTRAKADEGARLESETRQRYQATPKRANVYAISELPFQNRHFICVRNLDVPQGFEPHVSQSYHNRRSYLEGMRTDSGRRLIPDEQGSEDGMSRILYRARLSSMNEPGRKRMPALSTPNRNANRKRGENQKTAPDADQTDRRSQPQVAHG